MTRRESMIQRMIGIGFTAERAVEMYERYLHENKSDDLDWYIRLCEYDPGVQRHSER